MNPYVLAIMASIFITFIGLIIFALLQDLSWLLAMLALVAVYGFTPRRWFDGT